MHNIKVSIIVPIYNVSKYIEQCLNSLINQTLHDIEIILVDDCGTDDSIVKAEKFAQKDKRIRIVHNKVNQGLSESRNNGLKYAKGEYVAFLDSDDFVDVEYYQVLYNIAKNSDADIAYSNVAFYYSENNINYDGWFYDRLFLNKPAIVISPEDKNSIICSCCCWNKLYRRQFIEKYNFVFPKKLYIEDIPYTFFSVMLANKLVGISDVNVYYRQRQDSIMSTAKKDKKSFDIFAIFDFIDNVFPKYVRYCADIDKYQKILDVLKIQNIYGWYMKCPQIYKNNFYKLMVKEFNKIDIYENEYVGPWEKEKYLKVYQNKIKEKSLYVLKYFQLFAFSKDEIFAVLKILFLNIFSWYRNGHSFGLKFLYLPIINYMHNEICRQSSLFGVQIYRIEKNYNQRNLTILGIPFYRSSKYLTTKQKKSKPNKKVISILGIITLSREVIDEG